MCRPASISSTKQLCRLEKAAEDAVGRFRMTKEWLAMALWVTDRAADERPGGLAGTLDIVGKALAIDLRVLRLVSRWTSSSAQDSLVFEIGLDLVIDMAVGDLGHKAGSAEHMELDCHKMGRMVACSCAAAEAGWDVFEGYRTGLVEEIGNWDSSGIADRPYLLVHLKDRLAILMREASQAVVVELLANWIILDLSGMEQPSVVVVEVVAGLHPNLANVQYLQSVVGTCHGHPHAAEMAVSSGLGSYHCLGNILGEHHLWKGLANGDYPYEHSGLLDHLKYWFDEDGRSHQHEPLDHWHEMLRHAISGHPDVLL